MAPMIAPAVELARSEGVMLAVETGNGTMVIQVTNNGSAGAVTTSGFDSVSGDTISTTNGDDFLFFVTVIETFSHLHVQALQ